MKTPLRPHPLPFLRRTGVCALAALMLFTCLLLLPPPASAQNQGSAAITGRVFNSSTGEYLNNARVRLNEYAQETFTDSSGQFTFSNLNPGVFRVEVLFTGLGTQAATVNVNAGQTVTQDFTFAFKDAGAESKTGSDTIVLEAFTVTTSKEMNGAAIAINEQRFADNFKTVVAADEFGTQPEGNVGEFMKFLPGVTIDYNGGEPRVISLNGAPSNNVPVTVAGFGLASASSGNTNRQVELEQMSVNNLSRIEVNFSPTPETSGSALAGSVNLVPRQAFERSRPEFNFTGFLIARSTDLYLAPQPGPFQSKERRVRPGFEFSYLNPVSKRFGFTISGANSTVFTGQNFFQNTWRGVTAATGGNYPSTTVDQPYLSQIYTYRVEKFSIRSSVGATLDFKASARDAFSFNFNYAHFWAEWNGPRMQYDINKALPGDVGLTFTHSNTSVTDGAKVELSNSGRRKYGQTIMPTLTWRHNGPTWKADLGLGYSNSVNHYRDAAVGYLGGLTARLGNVGVSFDNAGVNGPGKFTVKNAAGAIVDETNLNNYVIVNGTSNESDGTDTQRSINGSLRRDFFGKIPASLKIGGLISQQVRDISRPAGSKSNYNFVGADGLATNTTTMANAATDDNAGLLMDKYNSYINKLNKSSMPLYQVPDPVASATLFQDRPTYWVASSPINDYNSMVNSSKYARETIYAGYLRNDLSFFRNRLKIVSGLRLEQTDIYGEGPSNDPTRNFQRDAKGVILRTGNPLTGAPVLVFPAGTLDAQKLILQERGLKSNKEYLRPLPSANVSYTIWDNLIARGSYYWSLGRPDFNQYAGGVTLPNLANPPSATGNFIQVSNAGIKAWSATTMKVGLEYYFTGVGAISINGWQRDFKNLFGNIDFAATPAFLDLYGLSYDTYGQYYVRTTYNASDVTMRGLDFAYKQSLTFLPGWGRNFGVFTNASWTRFSGPGRDQLTNNLAVPRTAAWGINYSVPRISVMLNWNYRGVCRQSLITGTGIEAGTYNYQAPRLYCDLTIDYRMRKHFSFFANLRNLRNQGIENLAYGPNTPATARLRNYEDYGMELTGGVKAKF